MCFGRGTGVSMLERLCFWSVRIGGTDDDLWVVIARDRGGDRETIREELTGLCSTSAASILVCESGSACVSESSAAWYGSVGGALSAGEVAGEGKGVGSGRSLVNDPGSGMSGIGVATLPVIGVYSETGLVAVADSRILEL